MTFEQRRRLILITFTVMFGLVTVATLIWRESVARGLIWLFSESFGAVIALTIVSALWMAKAKRHQALNRMRPGGPEGSTRPQFAAPASALAGRLLIFALIAVALLVLMRGC